MGPYIRLNSRTQAAIPAASATTHRIRLTTNEAQRDGVGSVHARGFQHPLGAPPVTGTSARRAGMSARLLDRSSAGGADLVGTDDLRVVEVGVVDDK